MILHFMLLSSSFQDESGGYVKIDHIKKEIIDPNELTAIPMDQPLPPGAE